MTSTLIGCWYKDPANGAAGRKAFIVTRVGDAALMIAMLAIAYQLGTLNLDVRDTQSSAISLYENCGFTRWGTNPHYARVEGKVVAGHYYSKIINASVMEDRPDAPNLKHVIFGTARDA